MAAFRPAIWTQAGQELQRGRHIVARVPLRGNKEKCQHMLHSCFQDQEDAERGGQKNREDFTPSFDFIRRKRGLCETLGQKLDDLAERMAALEFEVSDLRRVTEENREVIHQVKLEEESLQVKLETMENRMRRDNWRLLRVPVELGKGDLKSLVVRLIKQGTQIEE
ncbi:hypothetical protein NDU88_004002 [Pleurodeles waltl]|uniref:Uncharacterized protein n=1 Tax=Pleurodeles waltl TaxID=8319 RepID=A0AAV7UHY1_PLEWA|nr:hypothetical protein NDU88_004002 [Pleurodeles waltl]